MLRTDRRTEGEEKAAKVNANKGCLQLLTQRVKQTMRRRRRRSIPQNRHCHICSPKSTMMRNGSQARVSSTLRPSRAVPHPSTNRALRRLTSEIGRDPVHSTRYGRQRRHTANSATSQLNERPRISNPTGGYRARLTENMGEGQRSEGSEEAERKADSTLRSSQAVPHPSTNRALRRLTSEVRRDPVHSTWYGRQR